MVNAARVSMGKHKTQLDPDDERLIAYLARNRHTSPFRHCAATFHIRFPISVERQFTKHRFGVEINSISGRYVEFEEDYYIPPIFRQGAASIKQGSLTESVEDASWALRVYIDTCRASFQAYRSLLGMGVCKEQARMLLPQSLWTEAIVTMSLQAASHFYGLRADSHAQWEIQQYAHAIGHLFADLYPVSWKALRDHS